MDPLTFWLLVATAVSVHAFDSGKRRSAAAWQQARQSAADRRAARDEARRARSTARAGRLQAAKTTGPRDPLWWPYAAGFLIAGTARAVVAAGQGVVEGVPRGAAEGRRFGREAGRRGWRTKRAFDEYRRRRAGTPGAERGGGDGGRDETVAEPCPACGVYVTALVADPGRELGEVCRPCAEWRAAGQPDDETTPGGRSTRHDTPPAGGGYPCDGTCTNPDDTPAGACSTCAGRGELVFNFGHEHGHRGCPDCNLDGPAFTRPRLDAPSEHEGHDPRCSRGLIAGHRGCPDCIEALRAAGHAGSDAQLEVLLIDRYDQREVDEQHADRRRAGRWPEYTDPADSDTGVACDSCGAPAGQPCRTSGCGSYDSARLSPDAARWAGGPALDGDSAEPPAGRGCDFLVANDTPGGEYCGRPVTGKRHEGDDEWFCDGHMGDEDAAAEMSICPRCGVWHDYRSPRCGGCDFLMASDYILDPDDDPPDDRDAEQHGDNGPPRGPGEKRAHLVTDPDGHQFVSTVNGEVYQGRDGYIVEPVVGIERTHGFQITDRTGGAMNFHTTSPRLEQVEPPTPRADAWHEDGWIGARYEEHRELSRTGGLPVDEEGRPLDFGDWLDERYDTHPEQVAARQRRRHAAETAAAEANAAHNPGGTTMTAPVNGQTAGSGEGFTSTVATLTTLARQLSAAHETSQQLGEQLSADELDADTITKINELMDALDAAAPQADATAKHVQQRHAPVAEAVAEAGGSRNVARRGWYDDH